mgnify:CR=1 FL=1
MATTTPNYGWTVPTSSDLVKNGATAIETLGDSVDDSLWSSGFGQAAKNKLINGDFSINQRAFTSVTTTTTYTFDRWLTTLADGTVTYTPQVFTAGAAPVAGYESTNFLRCVTTGQTLTTAEARIIQKIENVRSFAGQPVTISFWAKAATGTPSIAVELLQTFGSGGSASVTGIIATKQAITTGWARYSWTGTVPSISGKTVGTANDSLQVVIWLSAGSSFNARTSSLGIQSNTFDIWGVQAEYGSKATPFQLAGGGSPEAELAMCQRYLPSFKGGFSTATGWWTSTTGGYFVLPFNVEARVAPTGVSLGASAVTDFQLLNTGFASGNPTAIAWNFGGVSSATISTTHTLGTPTAVAGANAIFRGLNANSTLLFTGCEL